MRTKKSLRVLVLALAVVMVFGVMSSAFADSVPYKGSCTNWFQADKTATKTASDIYIGNINYYSRIGGYAGLATSGFESWLFKDGLQSAIPRRSGQNHCSQVDGTGKVYLQIHNTQIPGSAIYTEGRIYAGAYALNDA